MLKYLFIRCFLQNEHFEDSRNMFTDKGKRCNIENDFIRRRVVLCQGLAVANIQ